MRKNARGIPVVEVSPIFGHRADRHRIMLAIACVLMATMTGVSPARGQGGSFRDRLEVAQQGLLAEIEDYVQQNPQAIDTEEAHRWLFEKAREWRLEKSAANAATSYLTREGGSRQATQMANEIVRLSQARDGKLDEACADIRGALKGVSLRNPDRPVRFSLDLVAEAQMAGDYAAARHVLDETSTVFFLNQFVRQSFESRVRKLELCETDLPALDLTTIAGAPVGADQLKGKVILIDFWATNCAPCLEELPRLKRLYAELRSQGFEIVGLSLDDDGETLNKFVESQNIAWPIVRLGNQPGGLRSQFRVDTIPATFLVGPQGKIVATDLRGANLERGIRLTLSQIAP